VSCTRYRNLHMSCGESLLGALGKCAVNSVRYTLRVKGSSTQFKAQRKPDVVKSAVTI